MARTRENLMQYLTTEKDLLFEIEGNLAEVANCYRDQLELVRETGRLYEKIARRVETLRKATEGSR